MSQSADLHKVTELIKKAVDELERCGAADSSAAEIQSTSGRQSTLQVVCPRGGRFGNRTVASNVRRLFAPYKRTGKVQPKWNHKFCCLSSPYQDVVPEKSLKKQLHEAGLGEKKIYMTKTSDAESFKTILFENYPKLERGGGFDLLRSTSRICLDVISPPCYGYTPGYLADDCGIGAAIIYIRPIQKELDLSPVIDICEPDDNCPVEECIECGDKIPVIMLRKHIQECHEVNDSDSEYRHPKSTFKEQPICKFTCAQVLSSEKSTTIEEQCPVCQKTFPIEMLTVHAATCGEAPAIIETETSNTDQNDRSLQQFLEETISGDKFWDISIVRNLLMSQAMEQMESAQEIDWGRKLNITFLGEEGVDSGGLTREFLTLLFSESSIFEDGLLSLDANSYNKKHYYLMGKMVALGLLNGHPGPRNLKAHVVNFILNGQITEADQLPAVDRKDAATAITEIRDPTKDTIYLIETYADVLEASGFRQILNDANRSDAVRALTAYYQFNRFLPSLLQFIEGLRLNGVLDMLRKESKEGAVLLLQSCQVDSHEVKDFFKPVYSSDEKLKAEEVMVMFNFHQFLKKIERGQVSTERVNLYDEVSETIVLTMDHLLQALLGCTRIPKQLYKGIVTFEHGSQNLSTVNTCAPSINFSRIKELGQSDTFNDQMINIIIGAYGFGQA